MEKTRRRRTMSEVSSQIVSELMKILFLALSNPLYFSYFIFFSPYIYKLFSFLSPLFVTTTLLVLALITTTKLSLASKKVNDDEEHFRHHFEDSEVYKLVFDTASLGAKQSEDDDDVVVIKETCSEEPASDIKCLIIQESNNTIDFDRVDDKSCFGSPVRDLLDEDNKYTAVENYSKSSSSSSHVDDIDIDIEIDGGDHSPSSGFGSMRKEKEWRRTLACKLFEERHNGAGEEMDLLWETYEAEHSNDKARLKNDRKSKYKYNNNNNNKMRRNNTKSSSSGGSSVISSSNKGIIMNNNNNNKGLVVVDNDHNYSEDEDDDYEDETNGQLCCLQALKFSAGKMSLGMGKPSLVKFSKAFKGIGWLQNVARHAKKRYNNNNNRD